MSKFCNSIFIFFFAKQMCTVSYNYINVTEAERLTITSSHCIINELCPAFCGNSKCINTKKFELDFFKKRKEKENVSVTLYNKLHSGSLHNLYC